MSGSEHCARVYTNAVYISRMLAQNKVDERDTTVVILAVVVGADCNASFPTRTMPKLPYMRLGMVFASRSKSFLSLLVSSLCPTLPRGGLLWNIQLKCLTKS